MAAEGRKEQAVASVRECLLFFTLSSFLSRFLSSYLISQLGYLLRQVHAITFGVKVINGKNYPFIRQYLPFFLSQFPVDDKLSRVLVFPYSLPCFTVARCPVVRVIIELYLLFEKVNERGKCRQRKG